MGDQQCTAEPEGVAGYVYAVTRGALSRCDVATQRKNLAALINKHTEQLRSESSRLHSDLEAAKAEIGRNRCDEGRSIHCSTKEYPVVALTISHQTYGSGDRPGADYCIKHANLEKAIRDGFGDDLLIMLAVVGEKILEYKRKSLPPALREQAQEDPHAD